MCLLFMMIIYIIILYHTVQSSENFKKIKSELQDKVEDIKDDYEISQNTLLQQATFTDSKLTEIDILNEKIKKIKKRKRGTRKIDKRTSKQGQKALRKRVKNYIFPHILQKCAVFFGSNFRCYLSLSTHTKNKYISL